MPRKSRTKQQATLGYFNVDLEMKFYRIDLDSDLQKDRDRQFKRRYQKQVDKIRAGKTKAA